MINSVFMLQMLDWSACCCSCGCSSELQGSSCTMKFSVDHTTKEPHMHSSLHLLKLLKECKSPEIYIEINILQSDSMHTVGQSLRQKNYSKSQIEEDLLISEKCESTLCITFLLSTWQKTVKKTYF